MMTGRVVILVAVLSASVAATRWTDRAERVVDRRAFAAFPMETPGWRGSDDPPLTAKVALALGATDYLLRSYRSEGGDYAQLYLGYWASQRQGQTIHSPLNCLPGSGWAAVSHVVVAMPDPHDASASVQVNRYIIERGASRYLALYWYQSHGRVVASEYWGRFYLMADAVRLNRTDGAIVRIMSPIRNGDPDAVNRAEGMARRFAADVVPQLSAFLPE